LLATVAVRVILSGSDGQAALGRQFQRRILACRGAKPLRAWRHGEQGLFARLVPRWELAAGAAQSDKWVSRRAERLRPLW